MNYGCKATKISYSTYVQPFFFVHNIHQSSWDTNTAINKSNSKTSRLYRYIFNQCINLGLDVLIEQKGRKKIE